MARRALRSVSVSSCVAAGRPLLRSKRYVVLHSLLHAPNLADQVSEITALFDEVDCRTVDDENRSFRVVVKEPSIRFDEPFEIRLGDAPFEFAVAFAQPAQQYLRPRLQVNDESGAGTGSVSRPWTSL